MKHLALILLLLSSTFYGNAQQGNDTAVYIPFSGKVIDELTDPMIGIAIYIGDGHKVIAGGVSDCDGLFSIQVPELDSYYISLKQSGYIQLDTTLHHTENLNELLFRLKPSSKLPEEIRICGGGYANRSILEMTRYARSEEYYVSGQVRDEHHGPLINASIELLDSSNSVINTTVSNFNGNYTLKNTLQNTEYYIRIKAIGYIQHAIPIIKTTNDTTLIVNVQLVRDPNFKPFSSPYNLVKPALIDIDNPAR